MSRVRASRRFRNDLRPIEQKRWGDAQRLAADRQPRWLRESVGPLFRLLLTGVADDDADAWRTQLDAILCPCCGDIYWTGTHGSLTATERAAVRCGSVSRRDVWTRCARDEVDRLLAPLRSADRRRASREGKRALAGLCPTSGCGRPAVEVHRFANDGDLERSGAAVVADVPCCADCHADAHRSPGGAQRLLDSWRDVARSRDRDLEQARLSGRVVDRWEAIEEPLRRARTRMEGHVVSTETPANRPASTPGKRDPP